MDILPESNLSFFEKITKFRLLYVENEVIANSFQKSPIFRAYDFFLKYCKMITVTSCNFSDKEQCQKIFNIRTNVFVEEQQVSRAEEFDDFEESSLHYLACINGIPAGTARWRITKNGIKLERFAVLVEMRKKGVAAEVLARVLKDVAPLGTRIYLHAQVTAIGFYEKYGFKKEGPMFSEANIDHYTMFYPVK